MNKSLEGGFTTVIGGIATAQINNITKYYQAILIEEILNTSYSASAIKSPSLNNKDSFEVV